MWSLILATLHPGCFAIPLDSVLRVWDDADGGFAWCVFIFRWREAKFAALYFFLLCCPPSSPTTLTFVVLFGSWPSPGQEYFILFQTSSWALKSIQNPIRQWFPTWGTHTPRVRTRTFRGTQKKLNNDGKRHIHQQLQFTVTTYKFEITTTILITYILLIWKVQFMEISCQRVRKLKKVGNHIIRGTGRSFPIGKAVAA